jgi:hypothetical protein
MNKRPPRRTPNVILINPVPVASSHELILFVTFSAGADQQHVGVFQPVLKVGLLVVSAYAACRPVARKLPSSARGIPAGGNLPIPLGGEASVITISFRAEREARLPNRGLNIVHADPAVLIRNG